MRIRTTLRQLSWCALMSFTVIQGVLAAPPPVSYGVSSDTFHPVTAQHGMVASVDAMATQVGVDILRQGGNAVDAAIAVGFASYAARMTYSGSFKHTGRLSGGHFLTIRNGGLFI